MRPALCVWQALCEAYTSKVMCQKHPLPAAMSMDGDCDCKGAQNGANYTCSKMTTFEEGYVVIDEYEKCMSTLTGIVLPGVYAYPKWVQTTLYLLALLYCFLGVAVARPAPFRVPLCAALTLNATGQCRVTLSLRREN